MSTYTVPFIINGEERHAEKTFDVKSPDTGNVLHQCGIATEADALAAVEAAAVAGQQWRNFPATKRRDIILKAAEIVNNRRDELAQYMMDEVGAPRGWADFNLNLVIDMYKDTAGRVSAVEGTVPLCAEGLTSMVVKEPYGVVLAMAPWYVNNIPFAPQPTKSKLTDPKERTVYLGYSLGALPSCRWLHSCFQRFRNCASNTSCHCVCPERGWSSERSIKLHSD